MTRWMIPWLSFLLGSIPFGYLIVRLRNGSDLRSWGSGNIGATNVARSLGLGAGLITLVLDALKGACAVVLARSLDTAPLVAMSAGALAVLGHVFSPWLRFKGGKGVATGLGVFLALEPGASAAAVAVFLATVAVTRYVSLGSLIAAASMPLLLYAGERPAEEVALVLGVVLLIVWRHRENISRLHAGVETRFSLRPGSSAS